MRSFLFGALVALAVAFAVHAWANDNNYCDADDLESGDLAGWSVVVDGHTVCASPRRTGTRSSADASARSAPLCASFWGGAGRSPTN